MSQILPPSFCLARNHIYHNFSLISNKTTSIFDKKTIEKRERMRERGRFKSKNRTEIEQAVVAAAEKSALRDLQINQVILASYCYCFLHKHIERVRQREREAREKFSLSKYEI